MSYKVPIDCGKESCGDCWLLDRTFGGDYTVPACKLFNEVLTVEGGRDLTKFWIDDDDVVLRSRNCKAFEVSSRTRQPINENETLLSALKARDAEIDGLKLKNALLELTIAQHSYDDEMSCEAAGDRVGHEVCGCAGCLMMIEREKIDWTDRPAKINDLLE